MIKTILNKIVSFLKPEWISQEWREGSMGAAEKKSTTRFVIGATSVFALIYAILYFNVFDTFFYEYYLRAGVVSHIVSYVFAAASIWGIWKAPDAILNERSGWIPGALILGGLAAAIGFAAGWDFSLFKIG